MKRIFPHTAKLGIKSKWTFIFLIIFSKPDEVLALNIKLLITSLRKAKNNNKIKTIFCIKGSQETLNLLIQQNKLGKLLEGANTKINTIFFSENKLIESDPEFLFTEESFLGDFFKNIIKEQFPAKKYGLFTIDHSLPYGIFNDRIGDDKKNLEIKVNGSTIMDFKDATLPFFLANFGKQRVKLLFGAEQEEMPSILTMTELRDAILCSFKEKIDVIVMANCFTQFFDAGYVLRDAAKVLVASESEVNGNPINFSYFFDKFNKTEFTLKDFTNCLVNAIDCKPHGKPIISKDERSQIGGIFSNNLSRYKQLAFFIDKLSKLLTELLASEFETIYSLRKECGPVTNAAGYGIVDLFKFCRLLIEKFQARQDLSYLVQTAENILSFKCSILSERNYIGSTYPPDTLNGISIFFPLNNNRSNTLSLVLDFFENPNSPKASAFVKEHQWDFFIATYIDYAIRAKKDDGEL